MMEVAGESYGSVFYFIFDRLVIVIVAVLSLFVALKVLMN
jgi:hypothetical protein